MVGASAAGASHRQAGKERRMESATRAVTFSLSRRSARRSKTSSFQDERPPGQPTSASGAVIGFKPPGPLGPQAAEASNANARILRFTSCLWSSGPHKRGQEPKLPVSDPPRAREAKGRRHPARNRGGNAAPPEG